MKTTPKDTRKQLNNFRLSDDEGNVWTINAKTSPDGQELRVYAVYGDITKPKALQAALESLGLSIGCVRCKVSMS